MNINYLVYIAFLHHNPYTDFILLCLYGLLKQTKLYIAFPDCFSRYKSTQLSEHWIICIYYLCDTVSGSLHMWSHFRNVISGLHVYMFALALILLAILNWLGLECFEQSGLLSVPIQTWKIRLEVKFNYFFISIPIKFTTWQCVVEYSTKTGLLEF